MPFAADLYLRRLQPIILPDLTAERAASEDTCEGAWKAVDLVCGGDGDDEETVTVRTKLVRGTDSAAMCVSEGVGHGVLDAVKLPVADAYAVCVSKGLADVLTEKFEYENPVQDGRHWGTRLMRDRTLEVELEEASAGIVERLHNPANLFRMYLADAILAYPDRGTQGNALLRTTDKPFLVPIGARPSNPVIGRASSLG